MKSGYENVYNAIVHKLANCDFEEAAARLGFSPPVEGALTVHFLDQDYKISAQGVTALHGQQSDPNNRSLLIYYLTTQGGGEPFYSYSLPHYFIDGALGSGDLAWLTAPLVRAYGSGVESIVEPLKALGAVYQGERKAGEYIWTYRILPKIPMQIVYREADEEFPCQIELMLDKGAGRFLEFEQIGFLCGCFIETLIKMGQKNK